MSRRNTTRTMLCLAATVAGLSALGACSSGGSEAAESSQAAEVTTPDTAPAVIEDLEGQLAAAKGAQSDTEADLVEMTQSRDTAIAERDELTEQLETVTEQRDTARDQKAQAVQQRLDAKARADKAEARADTAETTYQQRKQRLDQRAADLDVREADVAAREQAVSDTEDAIAANSFGDGVYAVGTDIVAGTYHTDGGDGCYYAEYGADGTDIIDNGFTDAGPATTIIDSPFFESSDCGTWTLVG